MTLAIDPDRRNTIAAALSQLGAELEALGARLCGDPDLAARHCDALQQFDLITQKQQAIAALLLADCLPCAISALHIEQLRHELKPANADSRCVCADGEDRIGHTLIEGMAGMGGVRAVSLRA